MKKHAKSSTKTPSKKPTTKSKKAARTAKTKKAARTTKSKKAARSTKSASVAYQTIECEHGTTRATFVCTHVHRGVACGFHANPPAEDDPCPDAWCDLCERAFQAGGGEWNAESEKLADIVALCTFCYDEARVRNLHVPPLARGKAVPMKKAELERLFDHAVHQAQARQEASDKTWGWIQMGRWDYDPEASTLTFSDPAKGTLVADVVLVGSFSAKTRTFQWAWKTLGEGESARLQAFGEVRGIEKLTSAHWSGDETDGWAMTSLAAYLLGAETVYRAPFDHLRWFMLLRDWRRTKPAKHARASRASR
ncbi:MAG: DUF6882 domain-containing protein [Kofleriaceae bacterium]